MRICLTLPPLPSGARSTFPADDWAELAACKGRTDDLFAHRCNRHCHRDSTTCDKSDRVAYAREICEGCPVLAHCRVWALESHLESGMAGAMTEAERVAFLTRHGRRTRRKAV